MGSCVEYHGHVYILELYVAFLVILLSVFKAYNTDYLYNASVGLVAMANLTAMASTLIAFHSICLFYFSARRCDS